MTLPFVPGGPEPSRNGFSNFMPLTVMDRSTVTSPPRCASGKRLGYHRPRAGFNTQFPSGSNTDARFTFDLFLIREIHSPTRARVVGLATDEDDHALDRRQ